jgi:hypothetical protein
LHFDKIGCVTVWAPKFTNFEFLKEKYETLIFNMKIFMQKYPNIGTVKDFSKIIKVK